MPTLERAVRTDTGLASELRVAVMRLRRRLAFERDPANELSLTQMTVLGTLYRHGEMSVGELAAHERVQPPSMTRTVNGLVAGGHVVRRQHETDRRQVLVAITALGRDVLLADRKRRDAWLAQRLCELTPDQREILRRATPLLDALAQKD